MRGLLRAIVSGFGLTIGSHLAREGIAALEERLQREERERRRRRLVLAGVAVCLLGLAALALPVPGAATWLLAGLLAAGALAGTGVLLRPRLAAWRARLAERAQVRARERELAAQQARAAGTVAALERELEAGR